jgi:hypothetical protein
LSSPTGATDVKTYMVRCDFASGVTGQLHEGDTVELEDDVAAWVNQQASGTLVTSKKRGS